MLPISTYSAEGDEFDIQNGVLQKYNGKGGAVTIPNSVTTIGISAFEDCTGLTSVTIPNSVTEIYDSAFYGCTGLTSVTIPNSVITIGDYAFYNCTGLTAINVDNGNANYKSIDGIVYNKSGTELILCPSGRSAITIPNSVITIGDYAFYRCSWLTSVTIGNSVTEIGYSAFAYCRGLTSVTIPNSVTTINWYAFSGCAGLTSVTIPNSVTEIGASAFEDCTALTSVTIPNSVTTIGEDAFEGCADGFTIYGTPNSAAEKYAQDNGFKFIATGWLYGNSEPAKADVDLLSQYILNGFPEEVDPAIADMTHDGVVDMRDATYLARALAGWEGYKIG